MVNALAAPTCRHRCETGSGTHRHNGGRNRYLFWMAREDPAQRDAGALRCIERERAHEAGEDHWSALSGEGLMGMGSWPGSRMETGGAGHARADRCVCDIYTPMLFLMIQVAVASSRMTVDAVRGLCSRECDAKQGHQGDIRATATVSMPRGMRERYRDTERPMQPTCTVVCNVGCAVSSDS